MSNKNPFENINQKINEVRLQKREGTKVVRKRAGRPRKPNSERLQIRQDATIVSMMRKEAEQMGVSIGSVYTMAALFWKRNKDK